MRAYSPFTKRQFGLIVVSRKWKGRSAKVRIIEFPRQALTPALSQREREKLVIVL
jgi:hypothetical protein